MSYGNPSSFGEEKKVPLELTGTHNARRFTAATLALQGLLSGNGLLRIPNDEMRYAFATDAVLLADALLDVLDQSEVKTVEPARVEDTIYPGDQKDLQAVAMFDEQERMARDGEADCALEACGLTRVDTAGCEAPIPEDIFR